MIFHQKYICDEVDRKKIQIQLIDNDYCKQSSSSSSSTLSALEIGFV